VRKALQLVFSDDIRSFIFDLVRLLSAGDLSAAEARVRLRKGQAVPAQDAGQFADAAAAAAVNSDRFSSSTHSAKRNSSAAGPGHFHDWMLFLHPDQKALADAEFERPVILKGVSGAANMYPGSSRSNARQKVSRRARCILTLSTSLAACSATS